jgi:hypothetical protein
LRDAVASGVAELGEHWRAELEAARLAGVIVNDGTIQRLLGGEE